jgi:hypothetical protein
MQIRLAHNVAELEDSVSHMELIADAEGTRLQGMDLRRTDAWKGVTLGMQRELPRQNVRRHPSDLVFPNANIKRGRQPGPTIIQLPKRKKNADPSDPKVHSEPRRVSV